MSANDSVPTYSPAVRAVRAYSTVMLIAILAAIVLTDISAWVLMGATVLLLGPTQIYLARHNATSLSRRPSDKHAAQSH